MTASTKGRHDVRIEMRMPAIRRLRSSEKSASVPAARRAAARTSAARSLFRRVHAVRSPPLPRPHRRDAHLMVPGGCAVGLARVVAAAKRHVGRHAESDRRFDYAEARALADGVAVMSGGASVLSCRPATNQRGDNVWMPCTKHSYATARARGRARSWLRTNSPLIFV